MNNLKYLYHATTSKENAMSIVTNGFDTEEVFFSTKADHAANFIALYHGSGTYPVIEFDVSKLDMNKLEVSDDHNPEFFPKDLKAYVYTGEFQKGAVENIYTVTVERGAK